MPADPLKGHTRSGTKAAWTRDAYRRMVQRHDLSEKEIDEMRQHVIRLARALCEHVWGKRFC
jgi:hypothetical protein